MTAQYGVTPLELQVIGATIGDIREALGLEGDVAEGAKLPLGDGATLTVDDLSKSSGFDATTVVLTGMISVATTTSSAVLIEWLKSRLFRGGAKPDAGNVANVTVVINGKELSAQTIPPSP
jgi:hypothetical protein